MAKYKRVEINRTAVFLTDKRNRIKYLEFDSEVSLKAIAKNYGKNAHKVIYENSKLPVNQGGRVLVFENITVCEDCEPTFKLIWALKLKQIPENQ